MPSGSQAWRQTKRVAVRAADVAAFAPRTAAFAGKAQLRHGRADIDGPPNAALTAGLVAQVALDEMILAFFRSSGRWALTDAALAATGQTVLQPNRLVQSRGMTC